MSKEVPHRTPKKNLIISDNLKVLRTFPDNYIDLIYLDPPFNSKKNYSSKVDGKEEFHFKDKWDETDVDMNWYDKLKEGGSSLFDSFLLYNLITWIGNLGSQSDKYYLIYMSIRLVELHRVLKDTGSIYLHCDQSMSHALKLIMDAIFKKNNFRNEIVWCYRTGGASKKTFSKKHDNIFWYCKNEKNYEFISIKEKIYYKKSFFTNTEDSNGYYSYVNPVDWWVDEKPVLNLSKERTGYPTQKPLKLLERIIKASSNEKDLILDPFCGSGTTCIAAEKLNRSWIGIDINEKVEELIKFRFKKEFNIDYD